MRLFNAWTTGIPPQEPVVGNAVTRSETWKPRGQALGGYSGDRLSFIPNPKTC